MESIDKSLIYKWNNVPSRLSQCTGRHRATMVIAGRAHCIKSMCFIYIYIYTSKIIIYIKMYTLLYCGRFCAKTNQNEIP